MDDVLEVQVCCNTYGLLHGAMDVIDQIETLNDIVDEVNLDKPIEVVPVKSLEGCDVEENCPVAKVEDEIITKATSQSVMAAILERIGGNSIL